MATERLRMALDSFLGSAAVRHRRTRKTHQRPALSQHVVVTAGASGIGYTIAQAFRSRGARVCICDKAIERAKSDVPDLHAEVVDVANACAVASWFAGVKRRLGGLDVLINNAGIAGPTARVEDIADEALHQTLTVNVSSQFYCARLAVPMFKVAGGGSIINLSSIAGRLGFAWRSPYAASKWAVIGFTKSLAIELGEHQIRVNAILPGHVDTERFRRVVEAKAKVLGLLSLVDVRMIISANF